MGGVKTDSLGERFYWRIRRRMLYQNKNWVAVVCGETGSGKSYSALAMADNISPRGITIKRNVVFNAKDFMKRITNTEDLQAGDVIIFDEAGVGMSAREWYSIQNKLLGAVLQTFRHLNVAVIFTVPNLSFMDVQARKLLHTYFDTDHIDYENGIAYLRPYDIQHNSRLDKTYWKSPKFSLSSGKRVKVKMIGVAKIREDLAEEYERVKSAYTKELNDNALAELLGENKRDKPEKKTDQEVAQILEKTKSKYLREYNSRKYLDEGMIAKDLDITVSQAKRVKRRVSLD